VIRRLVTAVAVALLGLAGAGAATAAPAPTALTAPAAPADAAGAATLSLTGYGPAVLIPGSSLAVAATVSNPTALGKAGLNVALKVTDSPITTSAALESFLANPGIFTTRTAATAIVNSSAVGSAPNVLPPGGMGKVELAATPTTLGFPADSAGVYGVVIAITDAMGTVTEQTAAVTWYDAPITNLPLALVATASGSEERVQQVVAAASDADATLAIDPVSLTDAAQAEALASSHELFGLPSENPDLTSIAHSEDRTLLDFAITDAATNGQPSLRGLPWLATIPVVDSPTIALAASNGAVAGLLDVTGGARISATAPVADVQADGATLPVLVPNLKLSRLLATYRPGMPDAPARLVAEAALVALHGDGTTPVVVAPGSAWQLTELGASSSVTALLDAPWVQPVTARSVIDGSHRAQVTAPDLAGTDNDLAPDLIAASARQLTDVQQLAVTAEDPSTIYLPGGRKLLEPLASNLRADPAARGATYQASRDQVSGLLASLHVAAGSDVNLIAASGNVPVTLHNDLGVDATVTVVMRSSSPNLIVHDQPVVTIPAGSDLTVHIPVSGVKSANVTTTVALENADGDVVAAPQALRVRVRADWGNAITVVFAIGLGLLLIAGLIRTVRRGRGSTRMAPAGDEPRDTDAGGDDG
jgi:hypothetical protein